MYNGGKDSGGVVGLINSHAITIDFLEISETTRAEESLICTDQNGDLLVLTAKLNPIGDAEWVKTDSMLVTNRTIGMSQMTSKFIILHIHSW